MTKPTLLLVFDNLLAIVRAIGGRIRNPDEVICWLDGQPMTAKEVSDYATKGIIPDRIRTTGEQV